MNNSPLLNFIKVASTTHIRVLEQKAVRVRKGGNSLVLTRYLRSTSCLIVFLSLLCYYILCKSRQTSSTPMAAGKWITDIIFSATKGQLNSEWIYRSSQNVNQKFEGFLPNPNKLAGQKFFKFLVGILGETITSPIHCEFKWPLLYDIIMENCVCLHVLVCF